jgi:YidC/Oxa1 family membrane protein insertase
MEQKRLVIAFAVVAGLLFFWYGVVLPRIAPVPPPRPPRTAAPAPAPAPTPAPAPAPTPTPVPTPPQPDPTPPPPPPDVKRESFELEGTGLFQATFDNLGATLTQMKIRFPSGGNEWVELVRPSERRGGDFLVEGLEHEWAIDRREAGAVSFVTRRGALQFRKTFAFPYSDRYVFKVQLEVENLGEAPEESAPSVQLFNGIGRDSTYRIENYMHAVAGLKTADRAGPVAFKYFNLGGSPTEEIREPDRRLAGLKSRYFALLFIPRNPLVVRGYRFKDLSAAELDEARGEKNFKVSMTLEPAVHRPGEGPRLFEAEVYGGPIRGAELRHSSEDLSGLLDYTGFDFIGGTLLWLLKFFHSIFGNFGVAILFTTVVMRLCLFPFSKKGQLSMQKMQKLQPKVQLVRERYKHDPQRAAQEQWKLMREYKVNPMIGCFTMLLQLPIFLGMYSVLDISVDLRHSAFLWANDLSEPDRLVEFGRTVRFLFFSFDAFNLLPIMMTVAWVLQSMTMPKAEDPNMRMQQKMMTFMPIVFGFICYDLPSGLSWYFFVNSTIAFFEQKLIKRWTAKQIAEEFPES